MIPAQRAASGSLLTLLLLVGGFCYGSDAERIWTARESVQMTYFGERGGHRLPRISRSPDGKRFFFQTWRGDLATDANIYELHVFDAASVAATIRRSEKIPPQPLRIITLSSTGNHPAINGAIWTEDSRSIVFLGAQGDEAPQVYIVDVDLPGMKQLTHAALGVDRFEFRADSLLFSARVSNESIMGELAHYPASVVTLRTFNAAVSRSEREVCTATFVSYHRGDPRQIDSPRSVYGRSSGPRFWPSPDGRLAVVSSRRLTSELPDRWRRYESAVMSRMVEIGELSLVNIETGAVDPLVDAPIEHDARMNATQVLWSPDSRHAILANVAAADASRKADGLYIVDCDVTHHSCQPIAEVAQEAGADRRGGGGPGPTLSWLDPGRDLSVKYAQQRKTAAYRRANSRWIPVAVRKGPNASSEAPVRDGYGGFGGDGEPVRFAGGLEVTIEQGLNTPPAALARLDGRSISLTAPDPKIEGAQRAEVQVLEWPDASGRIHRGGLFLPDGAATKPAPLVIQIYDFYPDLFLPDGFVPLSAYAAQPLASEGIAVFQLQARKEHTSSAQIGPAIIEDIDATVAHLAAAGWIDPARVGLIGFSFGAYQVDYALTNARRTRFAAAVSAEGFTASYGYYLLYSVLNEDSWRQVPELNAFYSGTGSFWENKEAWMASAPGFNLDRITAPLLLSTSGASISGFGLHTELEFYAGLTINHKPFEYLYFPKGTHPLQRPRERFASQQASVDWMRFWLKHEEDSDPSKRAQYARWRGLSH